MTLLARIQARTCSEPGCHRQTPYPDVRYCEAHRLPWVPTWRKRLIAKELVA